MALDDTTDIRKRPDTGLFSGKRAKIHETSDNAKQQHHDDRSKKSLKASLIDAMATVSQGDYTDFSINTSPTHRQAFADILNARQSAFDQISPEDLISLSQQASETVYKNEAIKILNANSAKSVAMSVARTDHIDDLPTIMRAKYDAALEVAKNIDSQNESAEYTAAYKQNLEPIIQDIHEDLREALNNENVTYNDIHMDDASCLKLAEALDKIDVETQATLHKDTNIYHQALADIQAITMMHGKPYGFSSKAKAIEAKVAQHVEAYKNPPVVLQEPTEGLSPLVLRNDERAPSPVRTIKNQDTAVKSGILSRTFAKVAGIAVSVANKLKIKHPLKKATLATLSTAALLASCAFNTASDATASEFQSMSFENIAVEAQANFDAFVPNAVSDAYLMTKDVIAGAIETFGDTTVEPLEAIKAAAVLADALETGTISGEFSSTQELVDDGKVDADVQVMTVDHGLAIAVQEKAVDTHADFMGGTVSLDTNPDLVQMTINVGEHNALDGQFNNDGKAMSYLDAVTDYCNEAMKDMHAELKEAIEKGGTLWGVQVNGTLTDFVKDNSEIQGMIDKVLADPENVLKESQISTLLAYNIGNTNNTNMNTLFVNQRVFIPGITELKEGLNYTQQPSHEIINAIKAENTSAGMLKYNR